MPTSTCSLMQPLRLRHALGREHLRDAQLDLHEVVDRDPRSRWVRLRAGVLGAGCSVRGCRVLGAGSCLPGLRWSRMVSQRFLLLARPKWSVLHKRTLTLGSPPPIAIESKGVTRTADAAQDLGARRSA